jgi:hypothetical protein
MKLSGLLAGAAVAVALLGVASVAQARTDDFTYTSTGGTPASASGTISFQPVGPSDPGVFVITAITGMVDGDLITALINNPNSPGASTSTDGLFIFDNDVYANAPTLSNPGVLFSGKSGAEYNLFSTSPSDYTLYQAIAGAYTENSVGSFVLTGGIPEPATWLMMVLGVAAIGGGLRLGRGARPELAAG